MLRFLKELCYCILLMCVLFSLQMLFSQTSSVKIVNSITLPISYLVYNYLDIENKVVKILITLITAYLSQKIVSNFVGEVVTINSNALLLVILAVSLILSVLTYKQKKTN